MAKASGVRASKRRTDIESQISRAPPIVKTDIQQMGTQRELGDDARPIKQIMRPSILAMFNAHEKGLCIAISKSAQSTTIF
jgi:hypothetical protein